MKISNIKKNNFYYHLPHHLIAQNSLTNRDDAKLLLYNQNKITHQQFKNIVNILNKDDILVTNDTKVIPARIHLKRKTGAKIEILLQNPHKPNSIEKALSNQKTTVWKTMIGNLKKWKNNEILIKPITHKKNNVIVSFELLDRVNNYVKISWNNNNIFGEIISKLGQIPLPPYINRNNKPTKTDEKQYQTVFAQHLGAVAAPTASLHFTKKTINELNKKGIQFMPITLHVGAGTFLPISTELVTDHKMHNECFNVSKKSIETYLQCKGKIIAVGTTSVRTLESLYWIGFQLNQYGNNEKCFFIPKDLPYKETHKTKEFTMQNALDIIHNYLIINNIDSINGNTELLILPGYKFNSINGIITNFHLPESTLIMLIAAWVGNDWRRIYSSAIDNNYRFLSYGDSSLLLKNT